MEREERCMGAAANHSGAGSQISMQENGSQQTGLPSKTKCCKPSG